MTEQFTGRDFGRLESKVDEILRRQDEIQKAHLALEKRVRKQETRGHWYSGFAAAFGVLLGIGSSHIPKL